MKNSAKELNFILRKEILFYSKRALKLLLFIAILIVAIIAVVIIKYEPAYQVTIEGEMIGYVKNIPEFEEKFDKDILSMSKVAFYSVEKQPEYKLTLIPSNQEVNEEKVAEKIAENTEITYLAYAITVDGEKEVYVETVEEAEKLVKELSKKYKNNEAELKINIAVQEEYTQNIEDYDIKTTKKAKKKVDKIINDKVEQEVENQKHTVNGILLAQRPVTGTITSRYGARWGTTHCGLDIAAPTGTNIYAAGDGTVESAVHSNYGYGNLLVISHGNGVQTYYAHCSALYVTQGQEIKAGDLIAAVGSTGDSTGPHCHFEVRLNGVAVNPQNYIYND